jgi:hypothetical protein
MRLVLGIRAVAKGRGGGIEDDRDAIGTSLVQHREKRLQHSDGRAGSFSGRGALRVPDEREVRRVEERGPVDE